ncbi:hypothetical protein [Streptomyces sp. NPDC048106]|uniref:hypothetical protein n=1 Tax=Streptomyces sp. NPDC048106 TaxID=3155750 RepID=UPI003455CCC8
MFARLLGRSKTTREAPAEAAETEPAKAAVIDESSEGTGIPRQQSAEGVRE